LPKVEIVSLGAKHNRKDVGEVGETVEVSERTAAAMIRYGLAKPAEPEADEADENPDADSNDDNDEKQTGENPADNREKATSDKAAKRETRNADK
jgi:uncharacterized membrane protein YukC